MRKKISNILFLGAMTLGISWPAHSHGRPMAPLKPVLTGSSRLTGDATTVTGTEKQEKPLQSENPAAPVPATAPVSANDNPSTAAPAPKAAPVLPGQAKAAGFGPGTMFLGGTLLGDYTRWIPEKASDSIEFTNISVLPTVGYFIQRNLALTASLLITRNEIGIEDNNGDKQTLTSTALGAQIGAYYLIPHGSFYWYVGGSLSYALISTEQSNSDDTLEGYQLELALHGGILYMVTAYLGLELGLKAAYQKTSYDEKSPVFDTVTTTDYDGPVFTFGYMGVRAFF
ncbi:hypothetical protein KKF84_20970 [Myxococcota bacterium]|nr:hypothetical protein [Myxococcota bacterium]MBU1537798.1 hypothetical protein [Myxococcota bacterium]